MKRNKEEHYRVKIIQEFHLKKKAQQDLDKFIRENNLSYVTYYNMLNGKFIEVFNNMWSSITKTCSEFFKSLGDCIHKVGEMLNDREQ